MNKKSRKKQRYSSVRSWKDLHQDLLLAIFQKLSDDPKLLFKSAYSVCRSWRQICCMALFFNKASTIDLTPLEGACALEDGYQLMDLLKSTYDAWQNRFDPITSIKIPDYFPYFDDNHLLYLAQRFPKLKMLRLPYTTNRMTGVGFSRAIPWWRELEGLLIGPMKLADFTHMIQEIGINCKKLDLLVIYKDTRLSGDALTFLLDEYTSLLIANNLHNLTTLVLIESIVSKSGLENVMSKCKCLKSINLMWCGVAGNENSVCLSRGTRDGKLLLLVDKQIEELNTTKWLVRANAQSHVYNSIPATLSALLHETSPPPPPPAADAG